MTSKGSQDEYRSLSGQAETAEPSAGSSSSASSTATVKPAPSRQSTHSSQTSQSTSSTQPTQKSSQSSTSTAPTPAIIKSASSSLVPLSTTSAGQSPRTSRNASPIRKDKTPNLTNVLSTLPSAAAIQRALSSSTVQQLQQQQQQQQQQTQQQPSSQSSPATDPKNARDQKSASGSGHNTPKWPGSPRLKSPPPSGPSSRRGSSAFPSKPESATAPSISVQSATPRDATPMESASREAPRAEQNLQPQSSASKPLSRGPSGKSVLETVQENSSDSLAEPSAAALQASADLKPLTKVIPEQGRASKQPEVERHTQPGESGSESAGNKSDGASRGRRASVNQSTSNAPKPKTTSMRANYPQSAKRHSEGKQGMTVETETVPSIPQSGLGAGERGSRNESGSVKLKPSNETIRPKKERKKAERKTRSVNQGTATSKADLFEARVASAVDDANTSDSDETFVYESNPPEPSRRQRHHSRTPSVASSHSVAEQHRGGIRSFGDPFDDRRVAGKRSMKFASNPYNEIDSPENRDGTVRTHTPRHLGRVKRHGHPSASYDPDSPFTQAQKGRTHQLSANARSRPTSPRSPQSMQYRPNGLFGKKSENAYDFDAEQVADDERTPLVSSIRGPRGDYRYTGRRDNSGSLHSSFGYAGDRSWRSRCWPSPCLLMVFAVLIVFGTAFGIIAASNRPLSDVKIHKIKSVLASEQELMFDLLVGAVNPNLMSVTVNDMNINVFAKSKHVVPSTTPEDIQTVGRKMRRQLHRVASDDYNPNPSQDLSGHWRTPDAPPGHDHGTDPPDDSENEAPTMLLGYIYTFDQSLTFDASPLRRRETITTGQVRLMKPGNYTEAGGSERWQKVLQHPFELTVRGVIKYPLPISGKVQNAAVGASVTVHPEEGIDRYGNMRTEPVEHWTWVEWPDGEDGEDETIFPV